MPRIFMCYASEDRQTAENVQVALANAGYKVFFDEQSLPPGGDYQKRIHNGIASCDAVVFLASEAALESGRYTLTELELVRKQWPSPVGRVLPVLLGGVKPADLPAYLAATTVLNVRGNAAAEVRTAVGDMLAYRLRWRRRAIGGAAVGLLAVAATILALNQRATAEKDPATPEPDIPWVAMRGEVLLTSDPGDYIGAGETNILADSNGIITAQVQDGSVSIAFEGDESWSLDFAAPRGQELTPGTYAHAQRASFNNPLRPGMSVTGAGRGCNELDGEFTIQQIEINAERGLEQLDLQFVQRCDGDTAALRGTVRFRGTAES